MESVPGTTKFEKLRNFLVGRKRILENLESMGCRPVTADSQDKCGYCSKLGHSDDECQGKKRALGVLPAGGGHVPRGPGGCAICKALDHWKNECPERKTSRDTRAGDGGKTVNSTAVAGGQTDGGVVAVADGEVGSNTLRDLDCQRCKLASKLTNCPGCKKTSGINHCLLHCEGFMVLSVKDRVDIVKSSRSCAICLHSFHTTDKCFSKDKDNHICGVNGCP